MSKAPRNLTRAEPRHTHRLEVAVAYLYDRGAFGRWTGVDLIGGMNRWWLCLPRPEFRFQVEAAPYMLGEAPTPTGQTVADFIARGLRVSCDDWHRLTMSAIAAGFKGIAPFDLNSESVRRRYVVQQLLTAWLRSRMPRPRAKRYAAAKRFDAVWGLWADARGLSIQTKSLQLYLQRTHPFSPRFDGMCDAIDRASIAPTAVSGGQR